MEIFFYRTRNLWCSSEVEVQRSTLQINEALITITCTVTGERTPFCVGRRSDSLILWLLLVNKFTSQRYSCLVLIIGKAPNGVSRRFLIAYLLWVKHACFCVPSKRACNNCLCCIIVGLYSTKQAAHETSTSYASD